MARFNEILAARYSKALQKLFGIKGSTPVPVLASELTPSYAILSGAEDRFVQGWDRFGFNLFTAGVAGQIVAIMIRNPKTSGAVAVFEKIKWQCQNAGDQSVLSSGAQASDLGTIITPSTNFNFDNRGRTGSALIVSRAQAAAIADLNTTRDVDVGLANTNYDKIGTDIQEIPLLPGDAIQLRGVTLANSFQATFWWRERPIEDSEKF